MGRIINIQELSDILHKIHNKGLKVITTNGCFDLLTVAHVRYLKEARNLGDLLIVLINSDESMKNIKGSMRPIIPENSRAEIVASLQCVDYVMIFHEDNPSEMLRHIMPHIHVKGGDYSLNKIVERSVVEMYGGKIVLIPMIDAYSTSDIISKIKRAG